MTSGRSYAAPSAALAAGWLGHGLSSSSLTSRPDKDDNINNLWSALTVSLAAYCYFPLACGPAPLAGHPSHCAPSSWRQMFCSFAVFGMVPVIGFAAVPHPRSRLKRSHRAQQGCL